MDLSPTYFVFGLAVILSYFSSTEASPLSGRSRKGENHSHSCPDQDLTSILGDRRHHLQHFTPDLLCSSQIPSATAPNENSTSHPAKKMVVIESNSVTRSGSSNQLPGCSDEDLAAVAFPLTSQVSPCQFHLTCQYDPERYPAVLYQAVRTKGSPDSSLCPGNSICKSVHQKIVVLRKTKVGSCPIWRFYEEKVVRSFRCQASEV